MEFGAYGINVNAYAPGFISGTGMGERHLGRLLANEDDKTLKPFLFLVQDLANGQSPMIGITSDDPTVCLNGWTQFVLGAQMIKRGHFGKKSDIAGIVSYLASEDAKWVHGERFL